MKIINKNTRTETHPLFPSGPWDGFYTYADGPSAQQHPMPSDFIFRDGQISGSGGDSIGSFSWNGVYDKDQLTCRMAKVYVSHTVSYSGYADENGIWGNWNINDYSSGGFHLWPKEMSNEEQEKMVTEIRIIKSDEL